jgi:hypothetical protein
MPVHIRICRRLKERLFTNNEGPAETHSAEVKTLVEVVRPALHRLENLRVALRQAGRNLALSNASDAFLC